MVLEGFASTNQSFSRAFSTFSRVPFRRGATRLQRLGNGARTAAAASESILGMRLAVSPGGISRRAPLSAPD